MEHQIRCKYCLSKRIKLKISGKQVKADCFQCGKYIKFASRKELPTLKEIRAEIYKVFNKDIFVIEQNKSKFNYKSNEDVNSPNNFCVYFNILESYLNSNDPVPEKKYWCCNCKENYVDAEKGKCFCKSCLDIAPASCKEHNNYNNQTKLFDE